MTRALAAAGVIAVSAALSAACGGEEPEPVVVTVLVERPGGPPERATGFAAAEHRVVTVAHVLDGGGPIAIRGDGGGERPARIVRVDRAADLALLEARAGDAMGAPGASSPGGGSGVRVISARSGRLRATEVEVRRRVVARVRDSAGTRVYSRRSLELAADISGGDSGAPVVDADGRLLGVVFARSRRQSGTAYAVDAAAVERLLGR